MRSILMGILMLGFMGSLYGCGTIQGIGEDIGTVGSWITNSSEHVEESIKKNPPGSGE